MANFDTIKAEVISRLGGRTDISDRVTLWMNDAYFDIMLSPKYSFWELDKSNTSITTVDGTRTYSLSGISDLWFILALRDNTNEREIKQGSWKIFDRAAYADGPPLRYDRFGSDLILDPTSDGAYVIQIRYRYRPPQLAQGGDHLLGREWDELLTIMTVRNGYAALEQHRKAAEQERLLLPKMLDREEAESLEDTDADEMSIGVRMEKT